jgi:hypothetical protein
LNRLDVLGLVLISLMGIAEPVAALGIPLEAQLRQAVLKSSLVVVGRIVEIDPYDRKRPERTAALLIERILYGSCAITNRLTVNWYAEKWYPSEGVNCMTDSGPQLDSLVGQPAVWIFGDVVGEGSGVSSLCDPIFYEREDKARISGFAAILSDTCTVVRGMKVTRNPESEAVPSAAEKRHAVSGYLKEVCGRQ